MELAKLNGLSANCSFQFPNAFLEDIFKHILPNLPDISPFDPTIMIFRLMNIIPGCLDLNGFEDLKNYLTDDSNQLKLFQLSGKIADLFDQYLVFRPELIFQWEEKKEENRAPHVWQARLWRELTADNEGWHRAKLRQLLFEQIKRPGLDAAKLPARVSIFGISYLPIFHLQAFAELSQLIEINFFLINPCKEYWADIVSDQELKNIRKKHPRVAENVEWYHFDKGNRLLASLGTHGRYFFELISGYDCEVQEQFEEPGEQSTLARIQSDILYLRDREGFEAEVPDGSRSEAHRHLESSDKPLRLSDRDTSLQVHSCHSPMREIEVLHDNLLSMFEEDPELLPKDIIVMTPDIETYAPYVHAVFAAQTDDALRIPFSIADQSLRRESRMIDGFLALLDFTNSRFGAVQVIRLLEFSGIKQRFGLVDSDLKIIHQAQEGGDVVNLVDMGPQSNFAGQQILQYAVLGAKGNFLLFATPGFAVFLPLLANVRQPAAQNGDGSHSGGGTLPLPIGRRLGVVPEGEAVAPAAVAEQKRPGDLDVIEAAAHQPVEPAVDVRVESTLQQGEQPQVLDPRTFKRIQEQVAHGR